MMALTNARIITMRGMEIIERGTILVDGSRIKQVGPSNKVQIPAGTTIKDLAGMTVTPGWVDAHDHISGPFDNPDTLWNYIASLAYGVTTSFDPAAFTLNDWLAYADLFDTGEMPGPRVLSSGPASYSRRDIKSEQEAYRILRDYKEFLGVSTVKQYISGQRAARQGFARAAGKLGMQATAEGTGDFKLELSYVLDGFSGKEHSYSVQPLYEDVLTFLSRAGTWNTPTLLVLRGEGGLSAIHDYFANYDVVNDKKLMRFQPTPKIQGLARRRIYWADKSEQSWPYFADVAGDLAKAGVPVNFGSHGELPGLGPHWELWAMARGMGNHEALRSATIVGAQSLGIERDIGSVEVGKLADLIVLTADPILEIRNTLNIKYVMRGGRLFAGEDLSQIYPDRRPGPLLPWLSQTPAGSNQSQGTR
jgi:imidazolonepropionase-like amidohydrolase